MSFQKVMILWIAGILLCSGKSFAGNILGLQQKIDAAGANWVAAENWVTTSSDASRKLLLGGVLPAVSESADPHVFTSVNSAPEKFDWRDNQGADWMTPVKNQQGCGSCAAFAALGSLEASIKIVRNTPSEDVDLSEQHLFSCSAGECSSGIYLGDELDYLQYSGVPDEACLPYTAVDDNCADTCTDWMDRRVKIDSWTLLWQYVVDPDQLKAAVMEHPIPCYMEVYSDFYSYSSGVYEHVSGSFQGGHFVVIVGWEDARDCWICKNSWGETWGDHGYFRIKRDQVNIGSWAMKATYTETVETPTPTPVVTETPTPAATTTPTATSTCTPTVTPTGLYLYLDLPAREFTTGDNFYVKVHISNPDVKYTSVPLFVFLDVSGIYWFWPDWVVYPPDISFKAVDVLEGEMDVSIIDPFEWPELDSSGTGLTFWAALVKQDLSGVLSNIDFFEWEYH